MKCLECGNKEMTVKRGRHLFDKHGLRVTLLNVEIRECPSCGEREVVIPRQRELLNVLAHEIVAKPSRLVGTEVRFLRKHLGWSAGDLADHIRTTKETVSRWENDHQPINPQADRLLRLFVATLEPIQDYSAHDAAVALMSIDDTIEPAPLALSLDHAPRWHTTEARA